MFSSCYKIIDLLGLLLLLSYHKFTYYSGVRWPSGWLGLATGWSWSGSNPAVATSLRNFGNSIYPTLPVSFGGDTKSLRSLLSGVYARGSKRSHSVTAVDSTTDSKLPLPIVALAYCPANYYTRQDTTQTFYLYFYCLLYLTISC